MQKIIINITILSLIFTSLYLDAKQDRRCRFYDLAKIKREKRVAHSPIIQFYSSTDNIGNYLPILGIQKMLGFETDLWCMHDKQIDFEFINNNYKGAIIGGAGLLNSHFEPFWKKLNEQCHLPMIMWGLGLCLPYSKGEKAAGVNKAIVKSIAAKCDLINVRDLLTASYYELLQANISPCPTVVYLEDFKIFKKPSDVILFSSHEESLGKDKTRKITQKLQDSIPNLTVIDNIQRPDFGLEDYILEQYCNCSLLITSRLHGAIIAYGLDIPCIMLPGDHKLDSFYQTYGFGNYAKTAQECLNLIMNNQVKFGKPLDITAVYAFGKQASVWATKLIND